MLAFRCNVWPGQPRARGRYSRLRFGAQAGAALLFVGAERFTQGEIKTDLSVLSLKVALRDSLAVRHFNRVGNQTVAGGEGKIIPQVFIAAEVDLAGEMFMPRRGDEEVNMRRTVAVAA